MALKGTILKKEITDKILSMFEGSFLYNDGKEIRIPGMENGEMLQVKVALTCAKTAVSPEGENALPGAAALNFEDNTTSAVETHVEPTKEEKEVVENLLKTLGL